MSVVRAVTRGRVLLVVDYAENRIGLDVLLRAVVTDKGAVLRVLLVARSAGEWWERLGAGEPKLRAVVAQAWAGKPLATVVETGMSDEELVRQAVPFFATTL